MDWFEPIRALLLKNLGLLRWLAPAATGLAALALIIWRRRAGVRPAALVVIFGLAAWGQVFVGRQEWVPAAALYAAAALLLALWLLVLRGDQVKAETKAEAEVKVEPSQAGGMSRRTEILLVVLVVLVAAFARFYRFDRVPYGIEGDEAKWSTQTAAEMFAGASRWDSDYRHERVPYTYWVEAFFYRLMGISLRTARWQVAFLSVLATALFYLLARRMLGPPGALVATSLLAVSIADISASRLSHVEGQIKLPLIAAFTFLVYAVTTQRWYWYPLTGLAVVAGLLTFDTFFMAPVVIGLWMGWRLLVDRRVKWLPARGDWLGKPGRLLLFLLPILPVAQSALFYINTRRGDHNKSMGSLTREGLSGWAQIWPQLRENLNQTLANFSYQRWGDFLVNRDGPIFNAALIPLAALGLVYLIVRWRRGQNGLAPLWFLLLFFPAAVVFGSPWVRVFYPAFPAFYLMAAAGLMLLVRTVATSPPAPPRRGEGSTVPPSLAGKGVRGLGSLAGKGVRGSGARIPTLSLVAFLLLVGINNLYVYLHEIKDFSERITRREMADMAAANLAPGARLYVPYMPRYDDFVEWDREFLELVVWGTAPVGQEDAYYRLLPYDELLPALSGEGPGLTAAAVLYDHGTGTLQPERQAIIDAAVRCFPEVTIQPGPRFDVIRIPEQGLQEPACSAAVSVHPTGPAEPVAAGSQIAFTWETQPAEMESQAVIEIVRHAPGVVWLEAEDIFNSPSWYVEGRFAPRFSGRGYLGDWFDAQDVTAQALLPAAGRYTVWARTHRRETMEMALTISVAGQAFPAALHNPNQFNQWLWERLGELDLPAGPIPVTLHRDYAGSRHMSVFIDALVFSPDPGFEPEGGLWQMVYRSPVVSTRAGRFDLLPSGSASPEPSPAADARRWAVQVIAGDRLVDAVLTVDDPTLDIGAQEIWRVLSAAPLTPAGQADLAPGEYRWRVQVLDGDHIIGPTGAPGQWSAWTDLMLK